MAAKQFGLVPFLPAPPGRWVSFEFEIPPPLRLRAPSYPSPSLTLPLTGAKGRGSPIEQTTTAGTAFSALRTSESEASSAHTLSPTGLVARHTLSPIPEQQIHLGLLSFLHPHTPSHLLVFPLSHSLPHTLHSCSQPGDAARYVVPCSCS